MPINTKRDASRELSKEAIKLKSAYLSSVGIRGEWCPINDQTKGLNCIFGCGGKVSVSSCCFFSTLDSSSERCHI